MTSRNDGSLNWTQSTSYCGSYVSLCLIKYVKSSQLSDFLIDYVDFYIAMWFSWVALLVNTFQWRLKLLMSTGGTCMTLFPHVLLSLSHLFFALPPLLSPKHLFCSESKRWECVGWGDEVCIIHSEEHTLGDSAVQMNALLLRSAPAIVPKRRTCWARRWSASAVSVSLVSGYEIKSCSGEVGNLTGKQEGIGGDPGQWFPFPHSFGCVTLLEIGPIQTELSSGGIVTHTRLWTQNGTAKSPRSFTQVFGSVSIILGSVCVCYVMMPCAREAYVHLFFCHR